MWEASTPRRRRHCSGRSRCSLLQGTVEVCSPAARGPRSAGSLHARLARVRALHSHTCAILATGVKSEASCEVLGELSANLITDPAAALQAGPRCACGHQWRHLRCGGCGRATAHNPASAHFANFPDEATREEAIYAEDMTAVDADIAQLQRERLADIRRQAVLMQQMAASCAHEDVRALAG